MALTERELETSLKSVIADSSRDVILLIGPDGQIRECNAAAVATYGYSREELLGLNVADLRAAELPALMLDQLADPSGLLFEVEHRRKDGTTFPVEVCSRGVTTGDSCLVVSVIRDITRRKNAERALRASEERYRRIIEISQEGILAFDGGWRLMYINRRGAEMLEYAPEEIVGQPLGIFIMPEDDHHPIRKAHLESGICGTHEARYRAKSGRPLWCLLSSAPVMEDGRFAGCVVMVTDISERRKVEQTLRDSDERYRLLFDSSPEGIAVVGLDGCIEEANRVQAAMFLYDSPDELRGKYLPLLIAPVDRDRGVDNMNRRLRGEAIPEVEYMLQRRDGTTFPGMLSATVLRCSKGDPTGYICITRDITALKLEDAVRRRRTAFDAVMIEILSRFSACTAGTIEEAVTGALEAVARLIGSDHAFALVFSPSRRSFEAVYDWHPDHVTSAVELSGRVLYSTPWITDRLLDNQSVCLSCLDDFPPEAATDRDLMNREGARAALLVPVRGTDRQVAGCLGLHDHRAPHAWTEDDATQLTIVGNAIKGALERNIAENEVRRRAAFDEVLSNLLARLTTCSDAHLDGLVTEVLGTMAGFFGADHGYLLEIHGDGTYSATHEWCKSGATPRLNMIQRRSLREYPYQVERLLAGHVVMIDCTKDLPENKVDFLRRGEAKSILVAPTMALDGRVNGAVAFCRQTPSRPWQSSDMSGLRMLGNALVGALERRRAETARRESEARYRLLAEKSTDRFWLFDVRQNRYTYVSPLPERYFGIGFAPEEIISQPGIEATVVPEEQEDLRQQVAARIRALETGDESARFVTRILHLRRKDGTIQPSEVISILVTDADGRVTYIQGVTRDISERRRLEAQLMQAQKMEAVGRLAGGVAHDFNNMLSVIIGHTEQLLGQLAPGDEARFDLEQVLAAAKRSTELTHQLLAFARKQTIRPRTLNPNEAVESILKMLKRLIGEDIDLKWIPGKDIWPIHVDSTQIDQILANLTVNSRDAIAGTGCVTIETANAVFDGESIANRAVVLRGEFVMLAVSDTGCGMTPEVLARAFEPFFTTKEAGKGTGLGLATVYGIVKQNYGFVNLESEVGCGTTVRIYLPRAARPADSPKAPETGTRPSSGKETILVVEDEGLLRKLIRTSLQSLGYEALDASCPKEALRIAREHAGRIHLLMTDIIMPEMNGRELARRVEELRPGIRCLFTSGYTDDTIARRGVLEAGIHFLAKPFTLQTLSESIRETLEPQRESHPEC